MPPPFPANAALFAFWSPGPLEMLLLAVLALLFYGGDLPKVARSWGKSLTDFRRGLSGLQNDFNDVIYSEPERLEYRAEENWDEEPAPSIEEGESLGVSQAMEDKEDSDQPTDL